MVSVQNALSLINDCVNNITQTESLFVTESLGRVLAEDIIATINMPPFRQSAMDGYAIHIHQSLDYSLIGEVKAGDSHAPKLEPGQAVRIFTGAAVPESANAVVIQERVVRKENKITLENPPVLGANIRPKGEQIKTGTLALNKGTKINAATVAYLATLGVAKVEVNRIPKIVIIVTGSELIEPGKPLELGQIYESNGVMLKAGLANFGYTQVDIHKLSDDFQATKASFKTALQAYDIILVSGGISVGDYDFVHTAMQANGVQEVFYKVNQKPGKPLYFGTKNNTYVFGLPGNPASSLSCFYIYVLQALHKWSGLEGQALLAIKMPLAKTYIKKGNRAQFLKARVEQNQVVILDGQASSMIHSFASANALAYMPEEITDCQQGSIVTTYLIKH